MKIKCLSIVFALLLALSFFGCGSKEAAVEAGETTEVATATTGEVTTEPETESTSEASPTTEEPTEARTTASTTAKTQTAATTAKSDSYPSVQLKQSPQTYEADGWFYTTATNYYGDANIGSTFQYGGSAFPDIGINIPVNTKIGTKAGDDGGYALFITKDGTQTINYSSEGAMGTFQYSIFSASINGNDVAFKPGKVIDTNEFGAKVKVSGFFLVEVYAQFGTDEGVNGRSTLMPGTGLVLSEKEVDEFFATGKIAKYGNFDFSGLKDLIQAK